uniref:Uncharacterized protein n=1 Tax=Chrysemys picta bellii TaxID=8478 RepID=A0A8C3F5D8_CHRPI
MAPYRIRQYEDGDYEAVCTMFGHGVMEYAPAAFIYMLKCPQAQLHFLGLFLAVLAASGSLLVSLLALLVCLWRGIRGLIPSPSHFPGPACMNREQQYTKSEDANNSMFIGMNFQQA